jgi:hypothetical protein
MPTRRNQKRYFLIFLHFNISASSSRVQSLELTADKLDLLIERLTQLQQSLHSVI